MPYTFTENPAFVNPGDGIVTNNSGNFDAERIYLIGRQVINQGYLLADECVIMAAGDTVVINENGSVLTLTYAVPFPDRIEKQFNNLSDQEKNLIKYMRDKRLDKMVPVYVGKHTKNIEFSKLFDPDAEWTEQDNKDFLASLLGD